MSRNREYYPRSEEEEMVSGIVAGKRAHKSSDYRYVQKCKKRQRKAKKQCRKANIQLRNRIRNRDDQFIQSWSPEKSIKN